ncbi:hypothetical protein JTE90_023385 [Oedothorax gibbosus]|uniref:C2H2-type domain-containing protein n=1 Tax=Oedothorax gibbosus TaxID=931172 RepID=A0AAV6UFG9_9ARAC|nr:hypothetical protein JTE90_023385 [Oedothorax gibbosus]
MVKRHCCTVCSYSAVHKDWLDIHYSLTHKHLCCICGEIFTTEENLDIHFRLHTGTSFTCILCKKRFPTFLRLPTSLICVREIHAAVSYEGNGMNLAYSNSSIRSTGAFHSVDSYKRTELNSLYDNRPTNVSQTFQKPIFHCPVCGKSSNRKDNLTAHMKLHAEPQYSCSKCNKKFHRKDRLKLHMVFKCKQ